jgi:undecaprenyl-diphosphatase
VDVLQAVILGIVQGIGEFLPISSSGHLVIAGELLDQATGTRTDSGEKLMMNVTLHAGTLLSILIVYQREILKLRLQPRVCLMLILASIPAAAVGFTLKDFFERVFETPLVAGVALFGTAGLLVIGQRLEKNVLSYEQLTLRQSLFIGLFQAFALIPGISRSGSTISGGLICGLKRDSAAAFSFLMAIPVIGGAALLELKDVVTGEAAVSQDFVAALLAGGVTAFVVGLFSLRWLIALIAKGRLHWFAYYCAAVGTATIIWQLAAAVSNETASL